MKELYCARCQQYWPVEHFKSKDGKRTYSACRDCRRNYTREWIRKKKRPSHAAIWDILRRTAGNVCARCGYLEFASALEFQPLDESIVLSNVVNRYAYSPTERMWEELLDKARSHVLLCSNCRQALRAGDWSLESIDADWILHRPAPPML